MKRKTTTILAIAITASACGGTTAATSPGHDPKPDLVQELSNTPLEEAMKHRDHFAPLCDGAGYPLPGNVNSKESWVAVNDFCEALRGADAGPGKDPEPTPAPPPLPPPACDLDALNRELSNGYMLDDAVADSQHFRCLCDDKGYPLVGNINSKGAKASEFCAALKEKGLL